MADTILRSVASIALCAVFIAAAPINSSSAAGSAAIRRSADADACALLTPAEVSKALGVTSLAGTRLIASSPKACMWSDDPNHGFDHRRVTLSITSAAGFQVGKSSGRITTEPVAGIGDEAYYELPRSDSPFLFVRKGNTGFSVRVLNGLKLKAFTRDEEKSKEADLAKAAVARL
ncbi:MAG: hypothetical protein ACREPM_01770 [Gemmatimonadaceae bacterium]